MRGETSSTHSESNPGRGKRWEGGKVVMAEKGCGGKVASTGVGVAKGRTMVQDSLIMGHDKIAVLRALDRVSERASERVSAMEHARKANSA